MSEQVTKLAYRLKATVSAVGTCSVCGEIEHRGGTTRQVAKELEQLGWRVIEEDIFCPKCK